MQSTGNLLPRGYCEAAVFMVFGWFAEAKRNKYTNPPKRDAQNDAPVFEAHFGKKMIP